MRRSQKSEREKAELVYNSSEGMVRVFMAIARYDQSMKIHPGVLRIVVLTEW
jgi:hypothetical protein